MVLNQGPIFFPLFSKGQISASYHSSELISTSCSQTWLGHHGGDCTAVIHIYQQLINPNKINLLWLHMKYSIMPYHCRNLITEIRMSDTKLKNGMKCMKIDLDSLQLGNLYSSNEWRFIKMDKHVSTWYFEFNLQSRNMICWIEI